MLKQINLSTIESIKYATDSFKNIFIETLTGFKQLFGGKVALKEVSGPVGIFKVIGEMSKFGFLPISSLMAVLSINIGILNLLPIPATFTGF